jgi:hypothetical protein
MNDQAPPRQMQSESHDDIWALTNDWMAKIEKAYDSYISMIFRVTWITLLSGLTLVLTLTSVFLFNSLIRYAPGESVWRSDAAALGVLLTGLSVCVVVAIFAVRRFQQLHIQRRELADLLSIAEELFQMVISIEEKNATTNRYEYLVNHVRILEVKHLLKKVERVTGRPRQ